MEDTVVLKHHYIYMFRWDAVKSQETLEYMLKQFNDLNITNWIGKHELSEQSKPHYQMAVWTENKLLADRKDIVRKRFSRSKLSYKTKGNPCAFTEGRKIKNLLAYSTKDQSDAIINLPQNSIDKLPKWKNKNAEKIIFQDKLREYLSQLKKEYCSANSYAGSDELKKIIDSIVKVHIVHDINPPSKNRMLYYLTKYDFINVADYRKEIYNFRMFINDDYNSYC